MAGNQLSLTNVINVSLSQAPAGAGEYNTSNLAIFSREAFDAGTFGALGYKIYLSPQEVGEDFGTDSDTYAMANAIFAQKPNILAGNGYLVVIPFADSSNVVAQQTIAYSALPASGSFELNYLSDVTAPIAFGADAAALQTAVRTLTGLEAATVTGSAAAGFVVTMVGIAGPAVLLVVSDDSLQTADPINVSISVTTTRVGTVASTETLATAVNRTASLVQYFGILAAEITAQGPMLAAAAVIQALVKIAAFGSSDAASVSMGGQLDLLRSGGFSQSRGLYYGANTDSEVLAMTAAYMGRALSTNFAGSNTTQNMHLKDLATIQPDPSMTQSLLTLCQAAGADVYISLQGIPKVFTSGKNFFFDQVYNSLWFAGALQIAGFNYLATSSTKIPQTENGMDGLKGAYRVICEQAVANQYSAPGVWNSSTTFGNQGDFLANILQVGYYIFSQAIGLQTQAARASRAAPLVQIALKEAGGINSSAVLVNINA